MSLDRIVHWNDTHPTNDEIAMVIEDYVAGLGTIEWTHGRWFVTLAGPVRFARSRAGHATVAQREHWEAVSTGRRGPGTVERWIDVIPNAELSAHVRTYATDEVTTKIADGLADVLATAFGGRCDE